MIPALPKICVALGFSDAKQLLDAARREAATGETFLELRLDNLSDPRSGAATVRELLRQNPECVVLATCRRDANHGHFHGSVEEQLEILGSAATEGAQLLDVEVETGEERPDAIAALRSVAKLVVSYHNFDRTPPLDRILQRLHRVPADFYKLVTTAVKHSDNGRVLQLLRQEAKTPSLFIAMGETGLASRVLGPAWGGAFTYGAGTVGEGTAPGQVRAETMRRLYRVDRLTRASKIYGVIASPVQHSISPAVHNRAFQSKRLDAVYLPFLVQPKQLKDFFDFSASLPVCGFSVTLPHKRAVAKLLDMVDPLAKRIGAVNTVYRKAGKFRGTNTDVSGVLNPLSRHLRLNKSTVLIAGYGGAARGAACALADAGANVTITGRDPKLAKSLARFCGGTAVAREEADRSDFDVFLNTTPLGMFPHTEESFFPGRIPAGIVFDMVYNPRETRLLQSAREQGLTVIPGIEMFLEQAVKQFELWTGETAPRGVMEKAAAEALNHHS